MRTSFDFSPFYRSSIGFDRVFDMLENAARVESIDNWPAYDIAKTGDDSYRIQIAVAGFGQCPRPKRKSRWEQKFASSRGRSKNFSTWEVDCQ